jgi:hypothetical protein
METRLSPKDVLSKIREYFSRPDAVLAVVELDEFDGEYRCVYRKDGDPHSPVRCAIGCLIPDSLYSPAIEGDGAYMLASNRHDLDAEKRKAWDVVASVFDFENHNRTHFVQFLGACQSAHDGIAMEAAETDSIDGGAMSDARLVSVFLTKIEHLAPQFSDLLAD